MEVDPGAALWWNSRSMKEDDWDRLVGRFVIAFGDIENLVTSSLSFFAKDPIGKAAADLPLAQRMDLLEAVLSPRETEARAELLESVQAIRRYSKKRNIVAHNGLTFSFFHGEGEGLRIVTSIRSSRGRKPHEISHREMVLLVKAITSLALELSNAFVAVCHDEGIGQADD